MQSIGNRAAQHSHHELLLLLLSLFCTARETKTPIMMAATASTMRTMMKQIHRFLRAARADITALSVSCTLRETILGVMCWARDYHDLRSCCVFISGLSLCLDIVDNLALSFNENTHLYRV
jgi:hypothetical protein